MHPLGRGLFDVSSPASPRVLHSCRGGVLGVAYKVLPSLRSRVPFFEFADHVNHSFFSPGWQGPDSFFLAGARVCQFDNQVNHACSSSRTMAVIGCQVTMSKSAIQSISTKIACKGSRCWSWRSQTAQPKWLLLVVKSQCGSQLSKAAQPKSCVW